MEDYENANQKAACGQIGMLNARNNAAYQPTAEEIAKQEARYQAEQARYEREQAERLDRETRAAALQLSVSQGGDDGKVIARAEAYFKFLSATPQTAGEA